MLDLHPMNLEDVDSFVALRRLALKTDPDAFPWQPDEDPSSKSEAVRERMSNANPSDGPFMIGAFDPGLIGVVGVIRVSEDIASLWGMYVHPDWRRRGIGCMLLQEIQQLARGLPGVKQVVLSVAQSEEPAIRLYCSAGFLKKGEDQGSLHMVLDVNQD